MSNFITRKSLPRRTFLKGVGAAVALPFLDAMTPAFAAPAQVSSGLAPLRMAIAYIPNGVVMEDWVPAVEGAEYEMPRLLKSLESHREKVLVLSGLDQHNAKALGDGGGDHARAAATFLTGVHPRKTAGSDITNGISMDQVASAHIGHRTRLASLELSCDRGKIAGNCDSGYSCAYTNSISWRTATTPNPPEHNPRAIFERLFGRTNTDADPASAADTLETMRSVFDEQRTGVVRQLSECRHACRTAGEIHRQDRTGSWRHRPADCVGVQIHRVAVDVGKHRRRAGVDDGVRGRTECQGCGHDLVTGADTAGEE